MNFRTTVLILICLAIVVGLVAFDLSQGPAPSSVDDQTSPGRSGEPLFTADAFPSESISRIDIEQAGRTVTFERRGSDWVQTAPIDFRLDGWTLRQMVDYAASLRAIDTMTVGADDAPKPQDIKLDPPVATARFVRDDGKTAATIRFGAELPGRRGYVMIDDDKIHITDGQLRAMVVGDPAQSLRARQLTLPREGQLARVTITDADQTIDMFKTDTGWQFAAPHQGRVDASAITRLINRIGGERIIDFVEDASEPGQSSWAALGLDQPRVTLTLTQAGTTDASDDESNQPQTFTLELGARDLRRGAVFVSLREQADQNPVVFRMGQGLADALRVDIDLLRDTRLTPVKADAVNAITVSDAAGKIVLSRAEHGWEMLEPKVDFGIDPTAADAWLKAVTGAKGKRFVPDFNPGEAQPVLTVSLGRIGKDEPETLRLFAGENPDELVSLRDDETLGYVVDRGTLAPLFEPAVTLRDKDLLPRPSQDLQRLTFVRHDHRGEVGVYHFERHDPQGWQLQGETTFEQPALRTIIGKLVPLKVHRWLDASTKLTEPTDRITLGFDDKEHELRIDPRTRAARFDDVPVAFELAPDAYDALAVELRDRTALGLVLGDLASVRRTVGDATVLIERDESDALHSPQIASARLDAAAVSAMFKALAPLKAVRYLPADAMTDPTCAFTITTRTGAVHKLALDPASGIARLDDGKVFHVSDDTVKALTAPLEKTGS